MIETNCDIVREDFGVRERSQANLEAGSFRRGPLSPKHEAGVRTCAIARGGRWRGKGSRSGPGIESPVLRNLTHSGHWA